MAIITDLESLLFPVLVIGGGSYISPLIPAWVILLIVIGIFAIVGLTYMSLTSGNK